MDGDIGAMLQSVLSDPEQLAQVTKLAQGLMSSQGKENEEEKTVTEKPAATVPLGGGSPPEDRILSILGKAVSGSAGRSRSTELLTAMRPYMKPEKREKLDRAMKIAQMARVAGIVMGEIGGSYGL